MYYCIVMKLFYQMLHTGNASATSETSCLNTHQSTDSSDEALCIVIIKQLLFILSGCDAKQSFKEEPMYTEVNPGANAELRCVVENIGGECRWQKDGKVSPAV